MKPTHKSTAKGQRYEWANTKAKKIQEIREKCTILKIN